MKEMGPAAWAHIRQVLLYLLGHPGATKPQIAGATGLTASALHGMISAMEAAGVIGPQGMAASGGGRRPVQYALRRDAGLFVGICLQSAETQVGVFDLALAPRDRLTLPLGLAGSGPETLLNHLCAALEALLPPLVAGAPLLGLGVTVPGPVTPSGDVVEIAGAPGFQGFPLQDRLGELLGLPVAVDKDVYAGAAYLAHRGEMESFPASVYLSIDESIRAALVFEGRVFRGAHGLAGELGHQTARRDGIPCACGNVGCLELYCSDRGIAGQYNAQAGQNVSRAAQVIARMQQGDTAARRVISQAMGYLAEAISGLLSQYDPGALLIRCSWLARDRLLFGRLLDALHSKSLFTRSHFVKVRLLSEASPEEAAAALVLGHPATEPQGWLWRVMGGDERDALP